MLMRSNSTTIQIHLKFDNRLGRCEHVQVMWHQTKNTNYIKIPKQNNIMKKTLIALIMGSLGKYWHCFYFIL